MYVEEMLTEALKTLDLIRFRCQEVVMPLNFDTWNRQDVVSALNAINDIRIMAEEVLGQNKGISEWL